MQVCKMRINMWMDTCTYRRTNMQVETYIYVHTVDTYIVYWLEFGRCVIV